MFRLDGFGLRQQFFQPFFSFAGKFAFVRIPALRFRRIDAADANADGFSRDGGMFVDIADKCVAVNDADEPGHRYIGIKSFLRRGDEVGWNEFYNMYKPLILLRCGDLRLNQTEKEELIQLVEMRMSGNHLETGF